MTESLHRDALEPPHEAVAVATVRVERTSDSTIIRISAKADVHSLAPASTTPYGHADEACEAICDFIRRNSEASGETS